MYSVAVPKKRRKKIAKNVFTPPRGERRKGGCSNGGSI